MSHPRIARVTSLAALLLAPAVAGAVSAADAPRRVDGTYAIVANDDTAMIERWTRTDDSLRVQLDIVGQVRLEFDAGLTPEATITGMAMRVFPPGATAAAEEARAEFRGDSVIAVQRMAAGTDTVRRGTRRGAVPYLSPSVSLTEQIVRRARAIGGDSVAVPVFVVGSGGQTVDAAVRFEADSVHVQLGTSELRLGLAADGSLTGGVFPQQPLVRVVRIR